MHGAGYWAIAVLAAGLAFVVLLVIAGTAYQTLAENHDLKRYPPPGRMIGIGSRRLHLFCAGNTSGPTVVFEAGSGNDSTLWIGIVRLFARHARACTYDRAGLGWSDPAPGAQTLRNRAEDLQILLTNAGVLGPLILVGHSYGGYIVRSFAKLYPDKVVGIVLVDATEEGYTFDPWGLKAATEIRGQEFRLAWTVRLGLMRLGVTLFPKWFDPVRGVPPDAQGEMTALYLRASRHFARADEMAAYETIPQVMRGPHGLGMLGDLPLIVISRGPRDPVTGDPTPPEWLEAQARLVSLSSNSRSIVAQQSGHMIQFDEPEIIIDAVRKLWEEARQHDLRSQT